jgi:hypothetical protein
MPRVLPVDPKPIMTQPETLYASVFVGTRPNDRAALYLEIWDTEKEFILRHKAVVGHSACVEVRVVYSSRYLTKIVSYANAALVQERYQARCPVDSVSFAIPFGSQRKAEILQPKQQFPPSTEFVEQALLQEAEEERDALHQAISQLHKAKEVSDRLASQRLQEREEIESKYRQEIAQLKQEIQQKAHLESQRKQVVREISKRNRQAINDVSKAFKAAEQA